MSVTLQNIFDRVGAKIGDHLNERVPKEFITHYANEVQHKVMDKATSLRLSASLTMSTDTQSYSLASDFLKLDRAIYNVATPLILKDFAFLQDLDPDWENSSGSPVYIAIDKDANKMYVWRVPDSTVNTKKIKYWYFVDSTDLTTSSPTGTPQWNDEYHDILWLGTIAMVLEEDEGDELLAAYWWDRFNKRVLELKNATQFPERDMIIENEFSDMVTYQ